VKYNINRNKKETMTRAKCLEKMGDAFDSLLDNAAMDEEQRARSHGLLSEAMGLDASGVETYRLMELAATLILELAELVEIGGTVEDCYSEDPDYSREGFDVGPTYPWMSGFQGEPQPGPVHLPDQGRRGHGRELEQLTARISAIEKTQSDFFDQIDHIGERIRTASSDPSKWMFEEGFGDRPGSGDGHGRRARQRRSKKSRA
jgi:hypothetical protein